MNPLKKSGSNRHLPARAALERLVQRTLTAVGRPHERTLREYDCGILLERVIADLESLHSRTEQDFLAIGEKLVEFVATARQLSSDMTALSELIRGGEGCRAAQVLTLLLAHLRRVEAQAEAGDRALAGVCDSTRQVGRTFGGFRNTVAVFRVLASLTRIEAARLGNAGAEFGNLAEEVCALTQSIESSGQGILDASEFLHQKMQFTLGKVTSLHDNELKDLAPIIAEVVTSLESLEVRQRLASEASVRQATDYQGVSAAIEDLITALQFHDITRQQVEHVADSLRRLRASIQSSWRKRSAAPPDARAVLALQSSQLSNTERVFESSASRIESDLDAIAGRLRNMADASQMLMGQSAGEQDSFFVQMEGRFTEILEVVSACARTGTETRSALAELEEALVRMRAFVAQVRQIGIRIHRVAINAAIRAARIGDTGNALNVVSDVMQRLALDTNRITEEVAGNLDAISAAGRCLSDGSGWMQVSESPAGDNVLAEMRSAVLRLHSASEAAFSRLTLVTTRSAQFGDAIQSARAGFTVGTLFGEVINRARRALEQAGRQTGLARGRDAPGTAEQILEDWATHYTMQAERDVHQSVAAGADNQAETQGAVPDAEDLGQNVELF